MDILRIYPGQPYTYNDKNEGWIDMKMNESRDDNDTGWIIFQIKNFYWVIALLFSVAFAYLSGIDFRASNFHNLRVQALVFGLICGIFLIYINIFHTNYDFSERLRTSFAYLFCLSMIAYIYKPVLYDSSSYTSYTPNVNVRGDLLIAPVIFLAMIFALHIWTDRE
jgi:hypothetical protein